MQPVSYGAGVLRRLGTRFNQTQTATGRLAMDELNMQARGACTSPVCHVSCGRLVAAAVCAGSVGSAAELCPAPMRFLMQRPYGICAKANDE